MQRRGEDGRRHCAARLNFNLHSGDTSLRTLVPMSRGPTEETGLQLPKGIQPSRDERNGRHQLSTIYVNTFSRSIPGISFSNIATRHFVFIARSSLKNGQSVTKLGLRGLDLHKIKKYIMQNNIVYVKYEQHFLLRYTGVPCDKLLLWTATHFLVRSRFNYRANLAVCATSWFHYLNSLPLSLHIYIYIFLSTSLWLSLFVSLTVERRNIAVRTKLRG